MCRYSCSRCGKEYPISERRFRCQCGGALDLKKKIFLRPEDISHRPPTLWRYREAIPIENDRQIITLGEGMTPLVEFPYREMNILLKLDYLTPTGSFKDRGASVMISFLKEIGVKEFIEDSSGNAGASLAAYAAAGGLKCRIYIPDYTSRGKLVQIEFFGAELKRIPGTRKDTEQAVRQAASHIYYASHNWNPFFLEGLKTVAYEIAEQLSWRAPDAVICPLGYGGLFLSLYLGFRELKEAGVISRLPRLLGVQSAACCPVYLAYRQGKSKVEPFTPGRETLAEGICSVSPPRGEKILQVLRETGGAVTSVSEEEIAEGVRYLAGRGFFVEPTSAVVLGGLNNFQEEGALQPEDRVVVILTGSGLKAVNELSSMLE